MTHGPELTSSDMNLCYLLLSLDILQLCCPAVIWSLGVSAICFRAVPDKMFVVWAPCKVYRPAGNLFVQDSGVAKEQVFFWSSASRTMSQHHVTLDGVTFPSRAPRCDPVDCFMFLIHPETLSHSDGEEWILNVCWRLKIRRKETVWAAAEYRMLKCFLKSFILVFGEEIKTEEGNRFPKMLNYFDASFSFSVIINPDNRFSF